MKEQITVKKGRTYPYGISGECEGRVNIAIAMENEDCGIALYHKKTKETTKIPFDISFRVGNLYCVALEGMDTSEYEYCFYDGDRYFIDECAAQIAGNEKYGKFPDVLKGVFYRDDFEWDEDCPPLTPFHESVFYLLHVRGFTKHKSSGVLHGGTYEGVVEKIPYLKELGITAVLLMPSYEFLEMEERITDNERIPMAYRSTEPLLNYWGYKEGFYYAPKSAYAADGKNPVNSFKEMVKQLHKQGIEVLMQFYFPGSVSGLRIVDVLHYWVVEYHVDGFWLMGEKVPADILAMDPLLKKTKLLYDNFSSYNLNQTAFGRKIWTESSSKPSATGKYSAESALEYKNLALCHGEYMYDMRRFIKSDERMLEKVLYHMKANPKGVAIVHYMTETNGFTLADLVSYDRKHNEENGENNMDGNSYNASWNCGAEGKTRKKSVLDLRRKQMKNAFVLSMFAQSTPLILAGDEFANSQNGNNNAYCQDNAISWLNWNDIDKNNEFFTFVKEIIAFRKEHALLHRSSEYTLVDDLVCGYPDLSYHSEEPWKCNYDDLTRHFGMLFCGDYSEDESEKGTYIFLAVNMHWVPHDFVLPKLPAKKQWKKVFDTAIRGELEKASSVENEITVKERSIQVLIAK